jgi:hypothetical protein
MIKIKQSKTADSRTCDWSKVTKDQLLESSFQHIEDIHKGFDFFINLMTRQKYIHDLTKINDIDGFFEDFRTGFKRQEWWKDHQKKERHHFNNPDYVQEDINLIDVIDQIIDGVMAGLARSGEYRQERIDAELLLKAYKNTVDLLLKNVRVVEEND